MTYSAMYEMWRTVVEEQPFDLLLDLGHGESYPLKTHPWFFGVRIPMTAQDKRGLPPAEEETRLTAVENRIRELVRDRDGIYVGRRTGMGNRDLLIYFDGRPRGIEDRIRSSIGMEILFISRADPEWEGYEQLLPTPRDWRRIEDLKLVNAVMDRGGDAGLVHVLEHRVTTTLQKGAEAIAKLCEKLELSNIEITGTAPELVVTAQQLVQLEDDEALNHVTWHLESKSPKARGEYQGWTTEPVFGELPDLDDPDAIAFSDESALVDAVLAALNKG